MEVEYVACSIATQEAIWLRSFLQELNLNPRVDDLVKIFCDNIIAIQLAKDPKFHRKTTHIKRIYHFVRDLIKKNEIVIKYISTNNMIVDH